MKFDAIEIGGHLSYIVGGGTDNLGMFASAESDSHGILVGLFQFGLDEQSCGIDLGHPAGGFVVSVDGVFRIIEDYDCCFRHY